MALNRPLLRISWRFLWQHPWQSGLMVLGIALGVAMVVAIDLANSAASRAFDLSTEAVAGAATHQVIAGPLGVDEAVYTRLRAEGGGIELAAPVVTDYVTSPSLGNRPIQLLGVDPFAEAPFRSYLLTPGLRLGPEVEDLEDPARSSRAERSVRAGTGQTPGAQIPVGQLADFLTQQGAILISESLGQEYGLQPGDSLVLTVAGRQSQATIVGLLRPADRLSRRALDGLILADIATAQEVTGRVGRLDAIDLILPEQDEVQARKISALLPPGTRVVPVGLRSGAIAQMTAAFRTNLTALSLLALVVGMFLTFGTMTFSVVRRRSLFGALRCLGVTRGEIGRLVLAEATVVGALGSLLGAGLGILMGQGAVRLITQTINDLYFVITVRGVTTIAVPSLLKGVLLGLVATLVSAALPAWEATNVSPRLALSRAGLEDKMRRAVPAMAIIGAALLLLAAGLLALPIRVLAVSFAAIFFITIGFALLVPISTIALLTLSQPLTRGLFGLLGRMASRNITRSLSRTAVAIAALMIAVSVTIGVGVMVSSFRSTVVAWLDQTLWGDIYISAPSFSATRSSAPLDPQVVEAAREWPGVVRTEVLRSTDVGSPYGLIAIAAVSDSDFPEHRLFVSMDGSREAVGRAVHQAGAVLASEPLANRLGLPPAGARITLWTDDGLHEFPVVGVYRDYATSQGTLMMALDLYRYYWRDDGLSAAALSLAPGVDPDTVVAGLRERLAEVQGVIVQPNSALKAEALEVFDRAFAITGALQLLAAVVAFIGVLTTVLALQLERGWEFGVLRAVGLTPRQLRGQVLLETGLMGLVAGLLAMPVGMSLALILAYVINRRSFGWTLQFRADPAVFAQALVLAVAAALLAGLYPALRMSHARAAEALHGREE